MKFTVTAGQTADISGTPELIADLPFETLIADKGYDANWLRDQLTEAGIKTVIPARRNRKQSLTYDRHDYRQRNLVERLIGWVKHFRRAATRYEKTARNFLAFWHFGAIINLLK